VERNLYLNSRQEEAFSTYPEVQKMVYKNISELPESVRNHLPVHAQEIYKDAFNNAWQQYADPKHRRGNESQEEAAHKVAWAAVKQKYEKDEKTGMWREK
jgi:cation transport regulator